VSERDQGGRVATVGTVEAERDPVAWLQDSARFRDRIPQCEFDSVNFGGDELVEVEAAGVDWVGGRVDTFGGDPFEINPS